MPEYMPLFYIVDSFDAPHPRNVAAMEDTMALTKKEKKRLIRAACKQAGFGSRNFRKEVHYIGPSTMPESDIEGAIEASWNNYGSIDAMVGQIKSGDMVDVYILKRYPFSGEEEMWDNVIVRFDDPPTYSVTGYNAHNPIAA